MLFEILPHSWMTKYICHIVVQLDSEMQFYALLPHIVV